MASGFNFGTPQEMVSSGFSFGTPQETVSSGFSFGKPSGGINFGKPSGGINFGAPSSSGFNFGAPSSSEFNFGTPSVSKRNINPKCWVFNSLHAAYNHNFINMVGSKLVPNVMIPGITQTTIIGATPGKCAVIDDSYSIREFLKYARANFKRSSPQNILDEFINQTLKIEFAQKSADATVNMKSDASAEQQQEWDESPGYISTDPSQYYNKVFGFNDTGDPIYRQSDIEGAVYIVFEEDGKIVVHDLYPLEQIHSKPKLIVQKKDIFERVHELFPEIKEIICIEIGCCGFERFPSEVDISSFSSILGGKVKRSKKRKSKKTRRTKKH